VYWRPGEFSAAFLISGFWLFKYLRDMSELISQAFAWLFGEVFMGWVIGGTLKLIHSMGVKIYS
jgi:hypothetical protein